MSSLSYVTMTGTERLRFYHLLRVTPTQFGLTLGEMSDVVPTLVVFLPQLGTPFCREMLDDLRGMRGALETQGRGLVLVHMAPDRAVRPLVARYQLERVPRISDPVGHLYEAFGLERGTLGQVCGARVWRRMAQAVLSGHRPGRRCGSFLQMPGVFLVHQGEIVSAFRYQSMADRPDYLTLAAPSPDEGSELSEW
jgi:peroxiredoxin